MKRKRNLPVMYRTLLSLLFVALIPICSSLVVFYNYNVAILQQDIEQINLGRARQIRSGFEGEIMSQHRLRQSVYEDNRLLPLVSRGKAADLYDAMGIFREYISYRGATGDTTLWDAQGDTVLHRTGISSWNTYVHSVLQVNAAERTQLQSRIQNLPKDAGQGIVPLHYANGEIGLLFFYPLPANSNTKQFLLIAFSAAEVTAIFQPILTDLDGNAFLLNPEGELLFSTGDQEVVRSARSLEYQPGELVLPMQVQGQGGYSVIYTKASVGGLTYGVAVSQESYSTRVVKQITLIWQMVFMALMLCAVAILLLTMLNYRPIKLLMELLGAKEGNGDEYERIQNAVMFSRHKAELLENALQVQRPYVLERLLSYVFHSQLNAQQAQALLDGMDLRFEYPCFFVLCVRLIRPNGENHIVSTFKAAVIESAEAMHTEQAVCYTLERLDDDNICVVVNCMETLDRGKYSRQFYTSIDEQVKKGYAFTIGVGSIAESFDGMRNSMYEAKVLVKELETKEISFAEDMESLPDNYRSLYSVKDTMLFAQQLRQGDQEPATQSFQRQFAKVRGQSESRMLFRHAVSYMVNTLTDTVQQLCGDRFQAQIGVLLRAENAAEQEQAACGLIADFCSYMQEEKACSGNRLKEKILVYINENCTNPDLSLERIAEEFGFSTYYISRFFRDQNNMNFKDYLANLRIEKAKEWLTQTARPLGDIVSGLGYQSASSFIRKFKAVTGVTPGRYRDLYGNTK